MDGKTEARAHDILDGGPAFPSMRDWFAGHALAYMATIATHENAGEGGLIPTWSKEIAESLASDAYQIADAMLAARKVVGS